MNAGLGSWFFLSSSLSLKTRREEEEMKRETREKRTERRERCYRDPVANPNMPSPVT